MEKKLTGMISSSLALCVLFFGCSSLTGTSSAAESVADNSSTVSSQIETRIFTDSVGRKVTIPVNVKSAAPSGPLAQIVLYTAAPDKLAGLSNDFSEDAKQYIDEKYWSLPKFGQFYGKNASLNMEALTAAAPDVIIDIGETKETEKEDMDNLQKQLNIPTVFISATLDTMAQTYTMLGDLLGETDRCTKLSDYCNKTIGNADAIAKTIPDSEKTSIYMATGADGLNTNASGSIHADVLNRIGAVNAADVPVDSVGGGSKVSLEQIIQWNPDVIICDSDACYTTVTTDSTWKELNAVKNNKVYLIPSTPYSFISNPPSVNRIIGINWLGNLIYPDKFNMDVKKEVKDFYQMFYSVNLTDEQYNKIMKQ